MKKILILIIIVFLLSSCVNGIDSNSNAEDINDNKKGTNAKSSEKNEQGKDINIDEIDKSMESGFVEIWQIDRQVLATQFNENFVIKSDNTLWAWGQSSFDNRNYSDTSIITPIKIMHDVISVAAGLEHTLVIRTDGSLWAWGANSNGQLGDGTTTSRNHREPVKILNDVISVAAGSYTSFAVKSDGSLWAWGRNQSGLLGDGTALNKHEPIKIMDGVASFMSGVWHSYSIKTDGSLWSWGWSPYRQFGDGIMTWIHPDDFDAKEDLRESLPVKVMEDIIFVAAGMFAASFVIKSDGSLWVWGGDERWEVIDGVQPKRDKAELVKIMEDVKYIVAKNEHMFIIKIDNTLWGWGSNNFGELGDGTTIRRSAPVKIMEDVRFVDTGAIFISGEYDFETDSNAVSAGRSIAVRTDGTLWAWGHNLAGELGDVIYSRTPIKIADGVKIP